MLDESGMIEAQVYCTSCKRWLRHDKRWCPLFPEITPPLVFNLDKPWDWNSASSWKPGEKWASCACLIHTCFENPVERTPEESPTYKDFP